MKEYAVITGASAGIGLEFAREFAKRGVNIVVVARSEERLKAIAAELSTTFGIESIGLALDLAESGERKRLAEYCTENELDVSYLVNSAGYGSNGAFDILDLANELQMTELNCIAVQELSRYFIEMFLRKRKGTVINLASTAAFQPVPYMATYAATKAFILSFSLALRNELRGTGVEVMALCPGPVDTSFFRNAGMAKPKTFLRVHPPSLVIRKAFYGIEHHKPFVVVGGLNTFLYYLGNITPVTWRTWIAASMFGRKRRKTS